MLTRIGRADLAYDEVKEACQDVRDIVTDALHVDAADGRITWRYEQREPTECEAKLGGDGVEIRLEALVWTRADLDLAYEADAHAFAMAPEDRADACDVAADAFEARERPRGPARFIDRRV